LLLAAIEFSWGLLDLLAEASSCLLYLPHFPVLFSTFLGVSVAL
jgi:hypothetical protein